MSTTTPTTATMAELARFIGKPVRYEYKGTGTSYGNWFEATDALEPYMLTNLQNGTIRNIFPILRPLESLIDEEARKCYTVTFNLDPEPSFNFKVKGKKGIVISDEIFWLYVGYDGKTFCRTLDGKKASLGVASWGNTFALYDYLDSISIDVRGWLKSGLAVEKEEVTG
ncbi:hypothetical protein GCM10028807_32850 [Spirosoma daeguense]